MELKCNCESKMYYFIDEDGDEMYICSGCDNYIFYISDKKEATQ